MIPKHVQVGTIELVNVSLGITANTSATLVQSFSKLDEFFWYVVEESGDQPSEEKKRAFFCFTWRILNQSSSDIGRTSKLEHGIHTGNSTPIR